MIARLRGQVLEAGEGRIVVDCGGVGYEVNVPETVLVQCPQTGDSVELFIRQVIREDDQSLYGFLTRDQKRIFDLLREVKGCGARISLALLSSIGDAATAAAISAQDVRTLTKANGVGTKLAERICLELKDKVGLVETGRAAPVAVRSNKPEDELTEALMALGYRRGEIDEVCDQARKEGATVEEQLMAALKRLQK